MNVKLKSRRWNPLLLCWFKGNCDFTLLNFAVSYRNTFLNKCDYVIHYFNVHFSLCFFAQLCPTLGDPVDSSLPGSSLHGILQARILEWAAISFSRGSSQPRDQTRISCIAGRRFTLWTIREAQWLIQFSSVTQSCPTLCDPMNCSTPVLPVHHQHPEFTQTHVHWVSDAIHPSHPLSSPSPPAPNPSQHQSLFQWVNSSHELAKVLQFQL